MTHEKITQPWGKRSPVATYMKNLGIPRAMRTNTVQGQMKLSVRFDLDEAERASEEWGFNCGPAALCAVLDMTPEEIRPLMLDFEARGYTNPTLMLDVLKRLCVPWHQIYRSDDPAGTIPTIPLGLMRVQWGGRWTNPGVPMRARYRETHWCALRDDEVFDVNAMCVGGWVSLREWVTELIPWLIRECVPKGDGTWWPTHVISVRAPSVEPKATSAACTSL